jgi:hypothetical protein
MCIALTFTTPNGQGEFSSFDLFFFLKKQTNFNEKKARKKRWLLPKYTTLVGQHKTFLLQIVF